MKALPIRIFTAVIAAFIATGLIQAQVTIDGSVASPGAGSILLDQGGGVAQWAPAPASGDSDWNIVGSNLESGVAGSVGIGGSPGQKLDVFGNIRAQAATPHFRLSNGVSQWNIKNDADNFRIGDGAGDYVRVGTNGQVVLTTPHTDPGLVLDRTGGAAWTISHPSNNELSFSFGGAEKLDLNSGGTLTTRGGNMTVFRNGGDVTQLSLLQAGVVQWDVRVPGSSGDLTLFQDGTERVRVSNSAFRALGNVAIGSQPSGTKLDVVLQGVPIATGGVISRFVSATAAGGGDALISIQSGVDTGRSGITFGDTTHGGNEGSIIFQNGAGSANQHMIFSMFGHLMHYNRYGLGIKTGPLTAASNQLEVNGNASKTTAGDWLANSDRSIKTDIREIDNAVATINSLRPVKFRYTDDYKAEHPTIEDRDYYNYVAQEYSEVFPEDVKTDAHGLLMMDGHAANIVAIKAIQELADRDEAHRKEIAELRAELEQLKNRN